MKLPMRMSTKTLVLALASIAAMAISASAQISVKPSSHVPNLVAPYKAHSVPEPRVSNSPRIDSMMQDGKIMLSLEDAIALALENNLDLAIARYNLAIADTDVLRAKSGNAVRGVATGLVQGTPGGGLGGFGSGAPGAGAGGTSGGAGGAGSGASGLVQSTLGAGAQVETYDPIVTGNIGISDTFVTTQNPITTGGIPNIRLKGSQANFGYSQGFATGSSLSVSFNNTRDTTTGYTELLPALQSNFRAEVRQHLLSGFGFGPNLRFVRIAKNNREISDVAFRNQVIATIVQIQNIYWDLVSAFETVRVNEQSVALAQKTLNDNRAQVKIGNVAPIEVTRAESELAQRSEDLLIAQTQLQLQQLLMKNAITRSMNDRALASAPLVPTDEVALPPDEPVVPVDELINDALSHRPELVQTRIDLTNRDISRKTAANALLPSVDLVAWYGGSGLTGQVTNCALDPNNTHPPCHPVGTGRGYGGAFGDAFDQTNPDKGVAINVTIPLRNRAAQADQIRSELEFRQAQMRSLQLQNQVGIEVRNAQFAVQQNRARVDTARRARDLARDTYEIEQKRFALGASTSNDVLLRQRDFAQASSTLVNAMSAYAKSRVELDRSTGGLLARYNIVLDEAEQGNVHAKPAVPDVQRRTDLKTEASAK
jgi:outer membrane protein